MCFLILTLTLPLICFFQNINFKKDQIIKKFEKWSIGYETAKNDQCWKGTQFYGLRTKRMQIKSYGNFQPSYIRSEQKWNSPNSHTGQEKNRSRGRHNVEWFFVGILYFGWLNQLSSGTMRILHWDVIFMLHIYKYTYKKSFYVVSAPGSIFFIVHVKPIRSLLIQRTPAGSSFRLLD